jgi:hypothetical protein
MERKPSTTAAVKSPQEEIWGRLQEGFDLRFSAICFEKPDLFLVDKIIEESLESVCNRLAAEVEKVDHLAGRCYDACRDTYQSLQIPESPELFQAIEKFCLHPLFEGRQELLLRLLGKSRLMDPGEKLLAEQRLLDLLHILEYRKWANRLKIDKFDAIVRREGARRKGIKPGPKRSPDKQRFIDRAGQLRTTLKDAHGRITLKALTQIANRLDELNGEYPGTSIPKKCLQKRGHRELVGYNKKAAANKGAVKTWVTLVQSGDKDLLNAFRRLLSYCEDHANLSLDKI